MNEIEAAVVAGVAWGRPVRGIAGCNERVIEVPLALEVMQLSEPGWVLDAGCSLNGHLHSPMEPKANVVHLTQRIGSERPHAKGAAPLSYVSADLRDLRIFADGAFDRTVCVSTLEHVGLDNTGYFGEAETNPTSVWQALSELRRVTRGPLFLTMPFARTPWESGKFRHWTPFDLAKLGPHEARCFSRQDDGWGDCAVEDLPDPGDPVRAIVAVRL